MRDMCKQLLTPIGLCLLLGVIVNVMISLTCVIIAHIRPGVSILIEQEETMRIVEDELGVPWLPQAGNAMEQFGYSERHIRIMALISDLGENFNAHPPGFIKVTDIKAGWPLKSFGHRIRNELDEQRWIAEESAGTAKTDRMTIPMNPLWSGFLINTLLFSLGLFIVIKLLCCLRAARGYIRSRCGLCPACAYPVGMSDHCTECGAPIPAAARRYAVES